MHVLSHSLQRGSLIFDYMSVHETPRGAAIFRLREHVERFQRSAELMGLPLTLAGPAIEAAIVETTRANPGRPWEGQPGCAGSLSRSRERWVQGAGHVGRSHGGGGPSNSCQTVKSYNEKNCNESASSWLFS